MSAATPQPRLETEACVAGDAALMRAFDLLGRRWTGVLLGTLSAGPAGFRALTRAVPGISDSMLSDRLAALTNAGLITRAVDDGPPLSVTYELSHAGRALLPALEQISRWAAEHLLDAPRNQKRSKTTATDRDLSPLPARPLAGAGGGVQDS